MEKYLPNLALPRAFIVDIDGTVAINDGHRGFYEYIKVRYDKPNYPVIHLVEAYYEYGSTPLFVSGRMGNQQVTDDTRDWLDSFVAVPNDHLFLRKDGDYRPDQIIKYEIFETYIRDNWWTEFAFDDRNRVVKMWREIGLTCLQVAEGDF